MLDVSVTVSTKAGLVLSISHDWRVGDGISDYVHGMRACGFMGSQVCGFVLRGHHHDDITMTRE